jgi:hypothetical protein
MLPFRRNSVEDRRFPSYEDCPDIYYRFNCKGEYGPQTLDRVVSFSAARSEKMIEGRFADENQWRPLSYFLDLWNHIPASAHTIKRLRRAGVNPEGITECVGRKLLRDKQDSKPPIPRQIEYLRNAGIQTEEELNRKQVGELIRERERAVSAEQRRLEEAPEIEAYTQRVEELRSQVQELLPAWAPKHFDDAVSYMCYVTVVEDALDHANLADLESLQSGPFYNGLDMDSDYYLEFSRDPTADEMRQFQAALFQAYLDAESEAFDHLAILKRTLSMIEVSLM